MSQRTLLFPTAKRVHEGRAWGSGDFVLSVRCNLVGTGPGSSGRSRTATILLVLLSSFGVQVPVLATETAEAHDDAEADVASDVDDLADPPQASVGILWENDIFAQTDRHYTNGIRLGFLLPPPRALAEAVGRGLGRSCDWGIVTGQQMFTPEDLASAEPPATDRPYAGWLYAGVVLRLRGGGGWDDVGPWSVLDTFELDVGFVGHGSLAASTQRMIHKLTGSDPPKGGTRQVCEGAAVELSWLRQVRVLRIVELPLGLELDVVPHGGVTLGNIGARLASAGPARLGWGLMGDFGGLEDDALALPLAPRGAPRARSSAFGAWFVGRVDVRATAFDVLLEGSPLDPVGPAVRREPVVGSVEVASCSRSVTSCSSVTRTPSGPPSSRTSAASTRSAACSSSSRTDRPTAAPNARVRWARSAGSRSGARCGSTRRRRAASTC